jgi:hypothetical protein
MWILMIWREHTASIFGVKVSRGKNWLDYVKARRQNPIWDNRNGEHEK